jgi:hypothetical protein
MTISQALYSELSQLLEDQKNKPVEPEVFTYRLTASIEGLHYMRSIQVEAVNEDQARRKACKIVEENGGGTVFSIITKIESK